MLLRKKLDVYPSQPRSEIFSAFNDPMSPSSGFLGLDSCGTLEYTKANKFRSLFGFSRAILQ